MKFYIDLNLTDCKTGFMSPRQINLLDFSLFKKHALRTTTTVNYTSIATTRRVWFSAKNPDHPDRYQNAKTSRTIKHTVFLSLDSSRGKNVVEEKCSLTVLKDVRQAQGRVPEQGDSWPRLDGLVSDLKVQETLLKRRKQGKIRSTHNLLLEDQKAKGGQVVYTQGGLLSRCVRGLSNLN